MLFEILNTCRDRYKNNVVIEKVSCIVLIEQ